MRRVTPGRSHASLPVGPASRPLHNAAVAISSHSQRERRGTGVSVLGDGVGKCTTEYKEYMDMRTGDGRNLGYGYHSRGGL